MFTLYVTCSVRAFRDNYNFKPFLSSGKNNITHEPCQAEWNTIGVSFKKYHIAALYFILSEENKNIFRTTFCLLNPPASLLWPQGNWNSLCLIFSKVAQSSDFLKLFFSLSIKSETETKKNILFCLSLQKFEGTREKKSSKSGPKLKLLYQ